jgi:hypothetical protein
MTQAAVGLSMLQHVIILGVGKTARYSTSSTDHKYCGCNKHIGACSSIKINQ